VQCPPVITDSNSVTSSITSGGRGSHPLHRHFDIDQACINQNNDVFPCGRTRRSAPTQNRSTTPNSNHQPDEQRDAWWDVERECRETKVLASDVSGASVYRRLRQEREAPTTRANRIHVRSDISFSREGVAALPYTEFVESVRQKTSITTAPSCAGGHGGPPLHGVCQCHPTQIQKPAI
jgi:hypothetical protein